MSVNKMIRVCLKCPPPSSSPYFLNTIISSRPLSAERDTCSAIKIVVVVVMMTMLLQVMTVMMMMRICRCIGTIIEAVIFDDIVVIDACCWSNDGGRSSSIISARNSGCCGCTTKSDIDCTTASGNGGNQYTLHLPNKALCARLPKDYSVGLFNKGIL